MVQSAHYWWCIRILCYSFTTLQTIDALYHHTYPYPYGWGEGMQNLEQTFSSGGRIGGFHQDTMGKAINLRLKCKTKIVNKQTSRMNFRLRTIARCV